MVLSAVRKHGLSEAEVPWTKNAMTRLSPPPVEAIAVSMAFTTASRVASAESSSLARSGATPRYFGLVKSACSALASASAVCRGLIAGSLNSPTPTITTYGPCGLASAPLGCSAGARAAVPTVATSAARIAPENPDTRFHQLTLSW